MISLQALLLCRGFCESAWRARPSGYLLLTSVTTGVFSVSITIFSARIHGLGLAVRHCKPVFAFLHAGGFASSARIGRRERSADPKLRGGNLPAPSPLAHLWLHWLFLSLSAYAGFIGQLRLIQLL